MYITHQIQCVLIVNNMFLNVVLCKRGSMRNAGKLYGSSCIAYVHNIILNDNACNL